jgi:hypothetical protein
MTNFKGTVDVLAHLPPFPSRMSELSCYEGRNFSAMDTRALTSDLSIRETQRGAAATKIKTEDRGWRIEDSESGRGKVRQ